jgi:hypothetical protein
MAGQDYGRVTVEGYWTIDSTGMTVHPAGDKEYGRNDVHFPLPLLNGTLEQLPDPDEFGVGTLWRTPDAVWLRAPHAHWKAVIGEGAQIPERHTAERIWPLP